MRWPKRALLRRRAGRPGPGALCRELGAERRSTPLSTMQPMLAQRRSDPFAREGWVFELKFDGFRLLAQRDGRGPALRYRSGADCTAAFPEIASALAELPAKELLLDGELVILDPDGRPCFDALQARAFARNARGPVRPAHLIAFDLLALDGLDVRPLPLRRRKLVLRELLAEAPKRGPLRYLEHVDERGLELFEAARGLGLEGVVAKRAESPYVAGASDAWLKMKSEHTGDFAVIGLAGPSASTFEMPSLLVAARGGRTLRFAGQVPIRGCDLQPLLAVAGMLRRARPPCPARAGPGARWLEPAVVCEVRYLCWTRGGLLRHAVFRRFRPDKRLAEVSLHAS